MNLSEKLKKIEEFKEKCNEPLKTGWIKERKGDKGNMVKFIEGHYVVRALNAIFPLGWSTNAEGAEHKVIYSKLSKKSRWDKYKKKQVEYEQWIVLAECKMTLIVHPHGLGELCRRTNIGIGKSFSADEATAMGAAIKNAYTDAIKRCGKSLGDFFGLGLTLDEEVAEALGAIEASGRTPIDVFSTVGPKSSKSAPWLKPEIYEDIIDFYQINHKDSSVAISASLRNKILENTTQVFLETFAQGQDKTQSILFGYLADLGVATNGRALPTIGQLQQFLKIVTRKLVEGLDSGKDSAPEVAKLSQGETENFEEKVFSGKELGYKIIEAKDGYDEKYGNYVSVSLAVPTEETIVTKRVYLEDEEFSDLVTTLQGEELTIEDARELPERLVGQWGLADFVVTSDAAGDFTTVEKWRALARTDGLPY